jgi:predicted transcriptional regulator
MGFDAPMTRTISEQFIARVESFLAETGTKPSDFGRSAIGDGSFVLNLRRGRSPTLATVDKVLSYIEELEARTGSKARDRRVG